MVQVAMVKVSIVFSLTAIFSAESIFGRLSRRLGGFCPTGVWSSTSAACSYGADCGDSPCGERALKTEGVLVSKPECTCSVEGENCYCSSECTEKRKEEVCSELVGPCQCSRSAHAYCECQGYCHTIDHRIDACHSVQGCAWHGTFCDIVQRFKYDPVSGQLGPDFADEEWFNKFRRDFKNSTADDAVAAEADSDMEVDVI